MKMIELESEFDRQLETLLIKGYPKESNLSLEAFHQLVDPLKKELQNLSLSEIDVEKGLLPFVIVITDAVVPIEKAMSLVEREGKKGVVKLYPLAPEDFSLIDEVKLPDKEAYLLIDIDRGKDTINIPPNDAMKMIKKENRSPLSIEEGIALVTQFPEFLMKNNCYSLLASRHTGDKRVPAIWINADKNPNLGWCWDGNPHTWLGSASCKKRV